MAELQDYQSARQSFLELAARRGARRESLPLSAIGPSGERLAIDIAWLGASEARTVLVHSSGVHGVEGFAGGLVQQQWLQSEWQLPDDFAAVLVHGVNPFGMAWLRRVNENNVDLNRNCLPPEEMYAGAAEDYARLDGFLNPRHDATGAAGFYARAAWELLRFGKQRLAQAIAGGQYEFPQGLFYGGSQLEEGPRQVLAWFRERLTQVERLFVIDFHTGLGRYGHDELLVSNPARDPHWEPVRRKFGERLSGADRAAYRTSGQFCDAIVEQAPQATSWALVHEFGTFASVRVLKNLRAENQRWWYGERNELADPVKQQFFECFFPRDPAWRAKVITRGVQVMRDSIEVVRAA